MEYLTLIEHKNFLLKEYKHRFVKSFLSLSQNYTKSSFDRTTKLKVASTLFDRFFSKKTVNITAALQILSRHMKTNSKIKHLLSDLFLAFLSEYSHSLIQNQNNDWQRISLVVTAVDTFIKECQNINTSSDNVDIMPDDMAITFLEKMRRKSQKIRVLNTYRGIPIEFAAKIIHTSANKVLIKAHVLQDIAAAYQNSIYILSEKEFGHDLFAKATPRVLKGHDLLELSNFDQLNSGIHKRQTVRVYPEVKTTVLINNYSVTLFDISLGGVSIISPRNFKLELYEAVTIKIPDILLKSVLYIDAELIHVSKFEKGFKYHFKLNLAPSQESDIGKYIYNRQKEIIAELKDKII